jgi:hypothetical protein
MTSYRVSFFKSLLSSDGHQFKCLQRAIEIRRARSVERAVQAAEQRFARTYRVPDWRLYADTVEVDVDGKTIDYAPLCDGSRHAKYPNAICGRRH